MFIHGSRQVPQRTDCDICGQLDADSSKGYAVVARGATGRWCEVLWLCNNCGDDRTGSESADDARKRIETEYTGYADF